MKIMQNSSKSLSWFFIILMFIPLLSTSCYSYKELIYQRTNTDSLFNATPYNNKFIKVKLQDTEKPYLGKLVKSDSIAIYTTSKVIFQDNVSEIYKGKTTGKRIAIFWLAGFGIFYVTIRIVDPAIY